MTGTDPAAVMSSSEHWRNTVLAGLANYIDAGSIVAGSIALMFWKEMYGLSDAFIGMLGAFSANAISAGVGALVGGWLCDRVGRKKIYQWDMLVYAFGMSLLVFGNSPTTLVIGFLIVGLAVGADIPASWSLIAEHAPTGARGKHSGVAQVLWFLGPLVVLLMAFVLSDLGLLGARIIFAHLMVIALALTLLRSRMRESIRWEAAQKELEARPSITELFKPKYLGSFAVLIGTYGFWNLWAGTNGFFFPYIMRVVGDTSQATSVGLHAITFIVGIASIYFVFMQLSDKVNQRLLFAASSLVHLVAISLLIAFPLTVPVAILYVVLCGFGGGFGAQPFFQLWSSEMFPTLLRSTAQGLAFAVVRIGLGIFSFFVPILTSRGFTELAIILGVFLLISGVIGTVWGPRNEGKSLEQLELEREEADRAPAPAAAQGVSEP